MLMGRVWEVGEFQSSMHSWMSMKNTRDVHDDQKIYNVIHVGHQCVCLDLTLQSTCIIEVVYDWLTSALWSTTMRTSCEISWSFVGPCESCRLTLESFPGASRAVVDNIVWHRADSWHPPMKLFMKIFSKTSIEEPCDILWTVLNVLISVDFLCHSLWLKLGIKRLLITKQ